MNTHFPVKGSGTRNFSSIQHNRMHQISFKVISFADMDILMIHLRKNEFLASSFRVTRLFTGDSILKSIMILLLSRISYSTT